MQRSCVEVECAIVIGLPAQSSNCDEESGRVRWERSLNLTRKWPNLAGKSTKETGELTRNRLTPAASHPTVHRTRSRCCTRPPLASSAWTELSSEMSPEALGEVERGPLNAAHGKRLPWRLKLVGNESTGSGAPRIRKSPIPLPRHLETVRTIKCACPAEVGIDTQALFEVVKRMEDPRKALDCQTMRCWENKLVWCCLGWILDFGSNVQCLVAERNTRHNFAKCSVFFFVVSQLCPCSWRIGMRRRGYAGRRTWSRSCGRGRSRSWSRRCGHTKRCSWNRRCGHTRRCSWSRRRGRTRRCGCTRIRF